MVTAWLSLGSAAEDESPLVSDKGLGGSVRLFDSITCSLPACRERSSPIALSSSSLTLSIEPKDLIPRATWEESSDGTERPSLGLIR